MITRLERALGWLGLRFGVLVLLAIGAAWAHERAYAWTEE